MLGGFRLFLDFIQYLLQLGELAVELQDGAHGNAAVGDEINEKHRCQHGGKQKRKKAQ